MLAEPREDVWMIMGNDIAGFGEENELRARDVVLAFNGVSLAVEALLTRIYQTDLFDELSNYSFRLAI